MGINDIFSLAQAGMSALRAGNSKDAISCFEKIIASGRADGSIYLALAYSYQLNNNIDKSNAAIEELLALEPENLRGLMFKAEYFAKIGDDRSALSHYQAILKIASLDQNIASDMQPDLDRAKAMCAHLSQKFERFTIENIGGNIVLEGKQASRFKHSLALLFGKTHIYYQNPRLYYFPGLPQIYFCDRAQFSWLDELEAATSDIRSELQEVLQDSSVFHPYVQAEKNRPVVKPSAMLNNSDWSALYLWKNGEEIKENTSRFPKTMEALSRIELTAIPNRAPTVLFSLLKSGAKIPPHTGVLNTRLIGHLPIIVPAKCGLRVGSEIREWEEGKAWLFDDTIEHEAWNLSNQTRIILIFEIWRPELTSEERELVSKLMESINAYQDTTDGIDMAWDF